MTAPVNIIGHGCNAQGRMGSGVAAAIRETFPKAYETYSMKYINNGLILGEVVWVKIGPNKKYIANCITQEFMGNDGKRYVDYDAVANCMKDIDKFIKTNFKGSVATVAFPLIGAGLAGGDWKIISSIIEKEINNAGGLFVYIRNINDVPANCRDEVMESMKE